MSRSLLLFESAIKTEATKKQYTFYLKQFLTHTKLNDPDALLTLKDSAIQVMLEDYLLYLKKKLSPNSIAPIFAALELFLSMNDKTLNFKKIRKMFPSTINVGNDSTKIKIDQDGMMIVQDAGSFTIDQDGRGPAQSSFWIYFRGLTASISM